MNRKGLIRMVVRRMEKENLMMVVMMRRAGKEKIWRMRKMRKKTKMRMKQGKQTLYVTIRRVQSGHTQNHCAILRALC